MSKLPSVLIRLRYTAIVKSGGRIGKQAQVRAVPASIMVHMAGLAELAGREISPESASPPGEGGERA